MGDTCQPSTKQVYTFYSRNTISFKFFLLTVVALVPHHTVARPQDLFQTISGLTQELTNIAAAQAFQSQFEVPGLRIRPSDSSSGNRYFYSVSNGGGSAFASASGGPGAFVFSGPSLPSIPTQTLRVQPYRPRPVHHNPPQSAFEESSPPESFESVNLRLGAPNRGVSSSSSVSAFSPNGPVSVSAGASSSS